MNEDKDDKEEKTESNTKSVSINMNEEKVQAKNYNNNYDLIPFGNAKIPVNDYLILIRKIPLLGIKYFKFGNTINFYFCCSLTKREYKLSEIPTPLFTLGPECK